MQLKNPVPIVFFLFYSVKFLIIQLCVRNINKSGIISICSLIYDNNECFGKQKICFHFGRVLEPLWWDFWYKVWLFIGRMCHSMVEDYYLRSLKNGSFKVVCEPEDTSAMLRCTIHKDLWLTIIQESLSIMIFTQETVT